jgi:hypothetical protein
MKPGKVFIAEEFDHWPHVDVADLVRRGVDLSTLDPGDVLCFTGRFSAHWQSEDDQKYREGPDDLPVEEAIAWGPLAGGCCAGGGRKRGPRRR